MGSRFDASALDSSLPDVRAQDSSSLDSSAPDSARQDGSARDTSHPDTALPDTALPDTALPDTALPDAALPDTSLPDTSLPDLGFPPGWWDMDWRGRCRLNFDNSAQVEDLDDFPVMVALSDGRIPYGDMAADGDDLRLLDADGVTELAFEIEEWDVGGSSILWVRVPRIDGSSSSDHIWLYYDNASAGSAEDPAATWHADYRAVYHLNQDAHDSTAWANHGAVSGAVTHSGAIAGSYAFDGASDYIEVVSDDSIDGLFENGGTVMAWINPDTAGGGGFGRIVDKATNTVGNGGWDWSMTTGFAQRATLFERGYSTTTGGWHLLTDSIDYDTWQHVALSFTDAASPSAPHIYVNGQPLTVNVRRQPEGALDDDSGHDLRIGNLAAGTHRGFDGFIDELRLSKGERSDDWIAAQFLSMTDSLISYQCEHVDD